LPGLLKVEIREREIKMIDQEFPGNVRITISEKETRIWVCGNKGCKFRFKAMARAQQSSDMDYILMPVFYNKELAKALEAFVAVMQDLPTLDSVRNAAILGYAKEVLEKMKG